MTEERAGRLLVVDFDYFFPNPTMTAGGDIRLYDWSARESRFHIGPVWYTRAVPFLAKGLPLPRCQEKYEEFWARFELDETGPPIVLADSNMYAGQMWPSMLGGPANGWKEVWLFDAHHDCGYDGADQDRWRATDRYDCSDWMRLHHDRGSRLHVRYPAWRADADGQLHDCEPAPQIPVDRRVDDDEPVPGMFDAVLVCRSGAWVPSWCDDQFEAFAAAAPLDSVWVDERVARDRGFDLATAEDHLVHYRAAGVA